MGGFPAYRLAVRPIHRISILDQTVEHLREGLRAGRWGGELPGVLRLAAECVVSKDTMRAALRLLEKEGLLSAGRAGGRRKVLAAGGAGPADRARAKTSSLRVAILLHHPLAEESNPLHQTLRDIQRELVAAWHAVAFAPKTQTELRFAPARIAKLVAATPADAWVVTAAPRPVLEFFAAQPLPAIALGGRSLGLDIASSGVGGAPGLCTATRRLLALGHRRIVLICGRAWRQPAGGRNATAYTAELAAHGIAAGDYSLPDFEPTAAGLRALFESLFRVTPPTALILESADYAVAAFAFLAQRGLAVPRDVSLVCLYPDASLQWWDPPLARLRHEDALVVRRVVRWCRAVARGQVDREPVMVPAEFDEGGTIGPVRPGVIRKPTLANLRR